MANQATPDHSLGPEFWAIIGTGVAIAALILTVAEWQRADMWELRQQIEAMQLGQSEIRERLSAVESLIGGAVVEPITDVELAAASD